MAIRASVTVSIGDETIGRFTRMARVTYDDVSTSCGKTSERPGRSRTSSNVSPAAADQIGASRAAEAGSISASSSPSRPAKASCAGVPERTESDVTCTSLWALARRVQAGHPMRPDMRAGATRHREARLPYTTVAMSTAYGNAESPFGPRRGPSRPGAAPLPHT